MGKYDVGNWAFARKMFAINGIIQGFTWLVLALICVGMFFMVPESIKNFESLMISQYTPFVDLISFCIYDILLNRKDLNNNSLLRPVSFHAIVWVYAFLSFCWFGLSIYEWRAVSVKKSRHYTAHVLMAIGLVTLATCILDCIVFSLATVAYLKVNPFDYSLVEAYPDPPYDFQADIDLQFRYRIGRKIGYGIVMALTARGFVLWIFNCVAGSYSVLVSIKIFQTPPLLQYDDIIPRPKLHKKNLLNESPGSSIYMDDVSTSPPDSRSWYRPPSGLYQASNENSKYVNRHY